MFALNTEARNVCLRIVGWWKHRSCLETSVIKKKMFQTVINFPCDKNASDVRERRHSVGDECKGGGKNSK